MSQKTNTNQRIRNSFLRMAPSFRGYVLSKLEDLEQFKFFTLSSIKAEKKSTQKRFEKDTKKLSEEQIKEYFDRNAEDYFLVEDIFPTISMYSFIIILYSYIENGLNTICNAEYSDKSRFHKKKGFPPFSIKYKDMKGDGISRSKLYLEKVIGLNLNTDKKPWTEIDTLRKIRNVIVHDNGRISDQIEKDGNIRQHIKHRRLKITDHGTKTSGKILIKPEYLEFILTNAKQFIKNIT